jgi:anti-sigma B factor antagonist
VIKFEETSIGNVLVVKAIESRITADVAPAFRQGLNAYTTKADGIVILDLSNVSFIDSSGLGALIGCLKAMGEDGELILCGAHESVANMFKLTRMNKVFRMFETPGEAASAVS